jgi:hypothetical protein
VTSESRVLRKLSGGAWISGIRQFLESENLAAH